MMKATALKYVKRQVFIAGSSKIIDQMNETIWLIRLDGGKPPMLEALLFFLCIMPGMSHHILIHQGA